MITDLYLKYYAKLTKPPKKTKLINQPARKKKPFPLSDVPSDIRTHFLCSDGFLDHDTALKLSSSSKGLRENIFLCTNVKVSLINEATLEFIKRFNNLKSLNLSESNVRDLDFFVKRFPQLEDLILHNCDEIVNYESIGSFRNLKSLNLDDTQITDLNFLTRLEQLKKLSLHKCENIIGFEPLNRITTLTVLNVSYTNFDSLQLIAGLINLQHLDLCSTRITSLIGIERLTYLIYLDISETGVSELQQLTHLTQLVHFEARSTRITDTILTVLRVLVNLRHLDLSETLITNLTQLEYLLNLRHLNLSKTQITDINIFMRINEILSVNMEDHKKINQLRYLDLSDTSITDISPLYVLTLLEHLNLSNLRIRNLDALVGMVNLISLNLSYTNQDEEADDDDEVIGSTLTNINGLRNCKKLQTLDLSGCDKIVNFDVLLKLTKLSELILSHSRIPLSIILQFNRLINLKKLNISSIIIVKDIEPNLSLPHTINELKCGGKSLRSLSFLSGMGNLEKLTLASVRQVSDFTQLQFLFSLKELSLYKTDIINYNLLPINLEELKLTHCQPPNLDSISLPKLQIIHFISCYTDDTINLEMLYSFILRHQLLNLIKITLNEQNINNIRKFVTERNLHIEIDST